MGHLLSLSPGHRIDETCCHPKGLPLPRGQTWQIWYLFIAYINFFAKTDWQENNIQCACSLQSTSIKLIKIITTPLYPFWYRSWNFMANIHKCKTIDWCDKNQVSISYKTKCLPHELNFNEVKWDIGLQRHRMGPKYSSSTLRFYIYTWRAISRHWLPWYLESTVNPWFTQPQSSSSVEVLVWRSSI